MQKLHAVLFLSMVGAAVSMTGCGSGSPGAGPSKALAGSVYGGSQAIGGASVQLWAAGITATSTSPTPTVQSSAVLTKSDGSFNLTGLYSCPADPTENVYLLARGGDAGAGPNSAIALMAMLGPCNSLSSAHVTINEESTVIAVADLYWFMDFSGNVGLTTNSTVTQNQTELLQLMQIGFSGVNTDVNLATGLTTDTNQFVIEATNTLADLLAVCVDSAPGGNTCSTLFGNSTVTTSGETLIDGQPIPTGYTPSDTLQLAILNTGYFIQSPPSFAAEYMMIPPQPPFQPIEPTPPTTTWGSSGTEMLAATATGDGIVHIPYSQGASGAFAVALGISTPTTTTITISTSAAATVPVGVTICQTNPNTGQCLSAPGTTVAFQPTANGSYTFSVFAQATAPITNSPLLSIVATDANGKLLANTSVTLTTN